jgi:phenylalanyl-tRNA synthetase alpha subunit
MSEKSPLVIELETLQQQAQTELAALKSESELQSWKTRYLGRSATVMQIFKRLPEAARSSALPSASLQTRLRKRWKPVSTR